MMVEQDERNEGPDVFTDLESSETLAATLGGPDGGPGSNDAGSAEPLDSAVPGAGQEAEATDGHVSEVSSEQLGDDSVSSPLDGEGEAKAASPATEDGPEPAARDSAVEDLSEGGPKDNKWVARMTQRSQDLSAKEKAFEDRFTEVERNLGEREARVLAREEAFGVMRGEVNKGREDDPFSLDDPSTPPVPAAPDQVDSLLADPRLQPLVDASRHLREVQAREAVKAENDRDKAERVVHVAKVGDIAMEAGIKDPSNVIEPGPYLDAFHRSGWDKDETYTFPKAIADLKVKLAEAAKANGGDVPAQKPVTKILSGGGGTGNVQPEGVELSELGSAAQKAEAEKMMHSGKY